MKMLFLGNSNDAGDWFEGGKKRHEIIAERLEEEFGEPVEVTVKSLWPNENLPGRVAEWIEKSQPDLIYITMSGYWFLYRSVPLRVQRIMGTMGDRVGDAGFRAAESKRWSHNAVFRGTRKALQETIGGDTHFTPQQVIDCMSEVVRTAVRHEGAVVVVKGPHGKKQYSHTPRAAARDERKRRKVHLAMKSLCAQLHVPYEGAETPVFRDPSYVKGLTVGDGLHSTAERHALEAEPLFETLRSALVAAGHEPGSTRRAVAGAD